MASFQPNDLVKANGGSQYMKVQSLSVEDGAEMVTCYWQDMWGKTQQATFWADELEAVLDPYRQAKRRRR